MIPAATLFEPLPIKAVGASLAGGPVRRPRPMLPARGVCVLLNGQTEFIEKYFEVIDELRGRGFAVATMDWRGQGGSSRLTEDSRKSFVGDFSEYDEDLETLMNWIVTPMLANGRKAGGAGPFDGGAYPAAPPDAAARKFQGLRAARAPMIAISFRGQREFLVRAVTALSDVARQAGRLGLGHGRRAIPTR